MSSAPALAKARSAPVVHFPNEAAASDQFFVDYRNSVGATYKALDFYETVYSRAPLADNFSTPLVRINNAYQIVPGVAHSWKQTSPTTWEFYITPGIMWTDGNELTANDFVETFRYSADPKHAWDFTWYWSGVIKNYTEAVAGKAPVNSIGVGVGKDKYTFVVTTEGPVAYHGLRHALLDAALGGGAGQVRQRAVQRQPGDRHLHGPLRPEDVQPDDGGRPRAERRSTTPGSARPSSGRSARSTPARPTCRSWRPASSTKTRTSRCPRPTWPSPRRPRGSTSSRRTSTRSTSASTTCSSRPRRRRSTT